MVWGLRGGDVGEPGEERVDGGLTVVHRCALVFSQRDGGEPCPGMPDHPRTIGMTRTLGRNPIPCT